LARAFWVRFVELSFTVGNEPAGVGSHRVPMLRYARGLKNPAAPLRYAAA